MPRPLASVLKDLPFPALVGAVTFDEALSLELGELLLDGLWSDADGLGQLPGREGRVLLEKGNNFLPTFYIFLPTHWLIIPQSPESFTRKRRFLYVHISQQRFILRFN